MDSCSSIIQDVYLNPSINTTIGKIKPVELRDDLRQEMALCLLEMPCHRVISIQAENGLVKFAMRVLMNMATGTKNKFYRTYKRKEITQAIEYFRALQPLPSVPDHATKKIHYHFEKKVSGDKNEAHEYKVFTKYMELGSCQKVADYYGIPKQHVWEVVRKVKIELKNELKRCL